MPNRVQTYALHDVDPNAHGGAIRINLRDAQEWNKKGFGIFHTVNEFFGKRRIDNLQFINSWFVEIDKGDSNLSKEEMFFKIKKGLIPTMIVESKNGYHVYWKAKDATKENWRKLLSTRLVPFYSGDKKAKDLARILRTPGFYHMKDPSDPFLVKRIEINKIEYSEREMFHFYKDLVTEKKQKRKLQRIRKENPELNIFWDKVTNINCEYALEKLSGTDYVSGEIYEFRENSSGTKNIYVNGKSSSCWIDQNGLIGSSDSGGPTIAQWLNWFHKDYKKVIEIIEKEFPECKNQNQINQTQMMLL